MFNHVQIIGLFCLLSRIGYEICVSRQPILIVGVVYF